MRPIDGTRVKEYLDCPRLPYLDFHASRDVLLPPDDSLQLLLESGRRHEAAHLATLDAVELRYPPGDHAQGFEATLEAMRSRAPIIVNGVLKLGEFLGRPDLLLLDRETSTYEVADIKSSRKPHASALLQIAFYARLLGQIERPSRRGHVILRDHSRFTFALEDVQAGLERVLSRLVLLRSSPSADPGPHRRETCGSCRWRGRCLDELEAKDDLSLVPDLTRAQKAALEECGVSTLRALAAAEPPRLARASGLKTELATRLVRRARAVVEGRPIVHGVPRPETFAAGLALAARVDERASEPCVALAGMVLGDAGKFRVRWLRAREAGGKEPRLERLELVKNLARTSGPILVWGPHARRALEEGIDEAAGDARAFDAVLARLLDLRLELRRAASLPGPDHSPLQAARAAGLDLDAGDLALRELAWLEEAPSAQRDAVEDMLRLELRAIGLLRDWLRQAANTAVAAR